MDAEEVVFLVVGGCWMSGVVGGQWMLEEWSCWSVDNGEVVLLVVGGC